MSRLQLNRNSMTNWEDNKVCTKYKKFSKKVVKAQKCTSQTLNTMVHLEVFPSEKQEVYLSLYLLSVSKSDSIVFYRGPTT